MNLVDTSGWMEYFFSEPNASYFATPIENIDDLVVSVICVYEVFKKVNAVADEGRALNAVAQMKQGRVINVTEEIGLSAAQISQKHKLPMADSLIYATAKTVGATLWTQDKHFADLQGVKYRKARAKAPGGRSTPRRS